MTEAALRTMRVIASTYVEDGYPNYHIWWFRLRDDDAGSSELIALGLIESIGVWRSYKLTREGKYWALQHRTHPAASRRSGSRTLPVVWTRRGSTASASSTRRSSSTGVTGRAGSSRST